MSKKPRKIRAPKLLTQSGFERAKAKELKRVSKAFKESEALILKDYARQRKVILRDAKERNVSDLRLSAVLNQLKNRKSIALGNLNRRYDNMVRRVNNMTYATYIADHEKVKRHFAALRNEIKTEKLKVSL